MSSVVGVNLDNQLGQTIGLVSESGSSKTTLANAIPQAKFRLVEGSGSSHVLPLERPNDFNEIVISFLDGHKKEKHSSD